MMALCLKQYCDSWAAKPFFGLFTLYFRRKMRLLGGEKLFFAQQILLAENVVKVRRKINLVPPTGITFL